MSAHEGLTGSAAPNPYFRIALASLELLEAAARTADEQQTAQNTEIARLQDLSERDHLTGLLNRRGLEVQYNDFRDDVIQPRNSRQDRTIGAYLLLLDLDDFKQINESSGGYASGDAALRSAAETLRANTRRRDIVGRLGGDEFIAILPRITQERAFDVAAAVREEIADHKQTTASIGIGQVDFTLSLEGIVQRANPALKQAKARGKNQVVLLDR